MSINATLSYAGGAEVWTSPNGTFQTRKFLWNWAVYESATMRMWAQRDYFSEAVALMNEWESDIASGNAPDYNG
jgi:hypothetical protein